MPKKTDAPPESGALEPHEAEPIPCLFATIHWRSPERPDGYTADEVELMNIEANRHIPNLYAELMASREARLSAQEAETDEE